MPGQLSESDLRQDLQMPEATSLLSALLNMQVGRLRIVDDFHKQHDPTMTYLDATVNLYIFVNREKGSRSQHLVDVIGAPRRTIRTSLERLLEAKMIVRDLRRFYFPAEAMAPEANAIFPHTLRDIRRLCTAYNEFIDARANRT